MTNVDNMFYSLGYEKEETDNLIFYKKVYDTHKAYIVFNKETQIIDLELDFEHYFTTNTMALSLNASKAIAINEKCKELRLDRR